MTSIVDTRHEERRSAYRGWSILARFLLSGWTLMALFGQESGLHRHAFATTGVAGDAAIGVMAVSALWIFAQGLSRNLATARFAALPFVCLGLCSFAAALMVSTLGFGEALALGLLAIGFGAMVGATNAVFME